jgi:large repetitive protein
MERKPMMDRVRRSQSEDGVTLIELLISIVIMSMIMGAIAASFVTAFSSEGPTAQRTRQSNDAQLIAGFLVRDAQSAGGTNPTTGTIDNSIGVSKSDAASCSPGATLLLRFSWIDQVAGAPSVTRVANYYFDSAAKQIVRKTCTNGSATSTVTLGREIALADASCNPGGSTCPNLPDTVTMHLESTPPANSPVFTYDLTASVRPEAQATPTSTIATSVPLLTLGGAGCNQSTTGVSVKGNPDITIYGPVIVNNVDSGNCSAWNFSGSSYNWSSGPISILNGGTCNNCPPGSYTNYSPAFTDPFAGTYGSLAAPCAAGGNNPAPSGSKYQAPAGGALVFPNQLNVTGSGADFGGGTYVFCNGIDSGNKSVTTLTALPQGVLFYIVSGGWSVGNGDSTVNGVVYAPTSMIDISGNGTFTATAVVSAGFVSHGSTPTIVLGTPPANNITIAGPRTLSLPAWTVGRPYPNTTITATGGGGSYTWSATGLPAGLSIGASTGVISGTPRAAGSAGGMITVVGSLGDVTIKPYTININAAPAITGPATLTDWTINRDYPGTAMIATGGTTPYTWTASGLPTGLSINAANGVVSGTPSATGTFTPTITLTDSTGATATRGYTIEINLAPSITGPNTLPDWTAGQVYPNQTMTLANGTAPYTWAASGLPTGLVINAVAPGVISGTPNAAGTFSVSVTLTDKAGASATQNYTVKINPPPGIATASLPTAEVGRPYNFTLTKTGGTPPYTWSLVSAPAWLSIGATTGTLTGTPPASGAPNVTIRVTDAAGASAQTTYTLTIAAAVQISGPATLPDWTKNRDYPGTAIIGTGGVTPFTWSATGLPAGLSINPNTGVISGTPTATGTFSITVTVVDALGGTDSKSYTVTINPPPSITTSSLPNGERTVAYSTTLAANNGTPPYSWAGSGLPSGLSMSAGGVLSGTPTVTGTFSITVTVTDVAGASASSILNLTLTEVPTVDPGTLPDWTVNRAYPDSQVTVSGGTAPYSFSATGLPAGLSIGVNSGIVSGTPAAAGTSAVTVTIQDAQGATSTQNYSVTINPAPNITTASLPSSTVGTAYPSTTLSNTGGTSAFSWTSTPLPAGLSISPGGIISGTPTAAGTSSVTVTVTDAAGATDTRTYSVTIDPPPPPSITTASYSHDQSSVTFQLLATGGTAPYTWSSPDLPGWLTLDSATGDLSGTPPTVAATYTFTVTVTDAIGASDTTTFTLTIT